MSYELEDISGIGKTTADKMKAAGIDSIEKLVTASAEDLVKLKIKGVGKATAEKIIINAKKVLEDAGDSEPWKHSRLRWLNSLTAMDDEVADPFSPMEVEGNIVSCLGRKVTVNDSGFPESIKSLFAPEMTHLNEKGREILAVPVKLVVESQENKVIPWKGKGIKMVKQAPGAIAWEAHSTAGPLLMDCHAQMEFDGNIEKLITIFCLVILVFAFVAQ